MLLLTTGVLIGILIVVITIYLWNIKNCYSYFKDRSIPTPPFDFFFGHYKKLWSSSYLSRQFEKWTKEYGSIYGLYEGTRRVYVVSDVNFLEEVLIKQFSCFHSRRIPFILRLSNGNYVHLFGADGNRWRRQRHIINPTFTNSKLKLMISLINESIKILLNKIENEKDNEINIYPYYKQVSLDIICRCAFGIDTDVQNNINNQFLIKSSEFFRDNHEKLFIVKLSYLMPWTIPFLSKLIQIQMIIFNLLRLIIPNFMNHFQELPGFWIINQIKYVINQRIKQTEKQLNRIDLLQLMLDAASSDKIKDDINEELISKYLHYDEVTSNAFLFLIAGHDSISITLTNSTYILSIKQDIQNKLRNEIDKIFNGEYIDYDLINNNIYLDLFIKEVLRMYPVSIQSISRQCYQNTIIQNYHIQKDDVIQADVYSIHYNKELWGPEDPNLFYPERHLTRRHPIAFMGFGQGPRNCIGLRFALMNIKIVLTLIIKQYFIFSTDKTNDYSIKETLTIGPEHLYIKFKKR